MNTASVIPFEGRLHTFEDPRRYLDEAHPGRPAPTPGAKTLLADIGLALANRDADAPFDQKQIGYDKGVLAAKRPPRMGAETVRVGQRC